MSSTAKNITYSDGYKYDFKLFLEGVEVPFRSATVASTPGGVHASINIYSSRMGLDLKPKTAVQIFYKDWIVVDDTNGKLNWRLMFDGAINSVMVSEQSSQGRMLSIVAKDFSNDLNRAPSALIRTRIGALNEAEELSHLGVYDKVTFSGKNGTLDFTTIRFEGATGGTLDNPTMDNGAPSLTDPLYAIMKVAGTSQIKKGGFEETVLERKGFEGLDGKDAIAEKIESFEFVETFDGYDTDIAIIGDVAPSADLVDWYAISYEKRANLWYARKEYKECVDKKKGQIADYIRNGNPSRTFEERAKDYDIWVGTCSYAKDEVERITSDLVAGGPDLGVREGEFGYTLAPMELPEDYFNRLKNKSGWSKKDIAIMNELNIELNSDSFEDLTAQTFAAEYIPGITAKEAEEASVVTDVIRTYKAYYGLTKEEGGKQVPVDGGDFLDAFARGVWIQAAGGTAYAQALNRRLRVNRRIMIPENKEGFKLFYDKRGKTQISEHIFGNGDYSTIMATIMRIAAMFGVKQFFTSTPTAIDLSNDGYEYKSIGKKQRSFYFKELNKGRNQGMLLLNEMMLLPPIEFTSPPACNIISPSIYNNIQWQHDYDLDYTRAIFTQTSLFNSSGISTNLKTTQYMLPTELFITDKDTHGRNIVPLTIEERYKGVRPYYNSIDYELGSGEVIDLVSAKAEEVEDLEDDLSKTPDIEYDAKKALEDKIAKLKLSNDDKMKVHNNAVARHALIKFLNRKYNGKVMQVGMSFNPYLLMGFPAVVLSHVDSYDNSEMKDIIGQVQQVQHSIQITSEGAEAMTSVVLTSHRFIDEPTDFDDQGNPLYAKKTDAKKAKIDSSFDYKDSNYIPESVMPLVSFKYSDYKIVERKTSISKSKYPFASDLLKLDNSTKQGESNKLFLDEYLAPGKIEEFYTKELGVKNTIMSSGGGSKKYMFDTIHEAIDHLKSYTTKRSDSGKEIVSFNPDKNDKPDFIYSYKSAIRLIRRDICTADQFFGGICDAPIAKYNDKGKLTYSTHIRNSEYENDVIHKKYYGYSTYTVNGGKTGNPYRLEALKQDKSIKPGDFSSIAEYEPYTYFTKERREAVESYLRDIKGTNFSG